LRVGQTRVSFESVWHMYQQGANPAAIVEAFDTLSLADIYAVLAWALRHPKDVDAYLKRLEDEAGQVRRQLEDAGVAPTPPESAKIKEKLKARLEQVRRQGTGDAAPADG
jgi:uncharacterized protein (DUF433 family)